MINREVYMEDTDYLLFLECNGGLVFNKVIFGIEKIILSGGFFTLRSHDPIYLVDNSSVDVKINQILGTVLYLISTIDEKLAIKLLYKYMDIAKDNNKIIFSNLERCGRFLGYYDFPEKSKNKALEYICACDLYKAISEYKAKGKDFNNIKFNHKVKKDDDMCKMTFEAS